MKFGSVGGGGRSILPDKETQHFRGGLLEVSELPISFLAVFLVTKVRHNGVGISLTGIIVVAWRPRGCLSSWCTVSVGPCEAQK